MVTSRVIGQKIVFDLRKELPGTCRTIETTMQTTMELQIIRRRRLLTAIATPIYERLLFIFILLTTITTPIYERLLLIFLLFKDLDS